MLWDFCKFACVLCWGSILLLEVVDCSANTLDHIIVSTVCLDSGCDTELLANPINEGLVPCICD